MEVMLALSIAIGLLVVVLYYYQQAALLRDSTLRLTAGLAAVRLCMDRLATEMRTASAQPRSFRGGPQDVEFLQCDLPDFSKDPAPVSLEAEAKGLPWRRIRYALPEGEPGAGAGSLVRTEVLATVAASSPESLEPAGGEGTNDLWAAESVEETAEGVQVTSAFPVGGAVGLTIPELRYLRLRYWDGAVWLEEWTREAPPRGVEVTLGLEPMAVEANGEAMAVEVFRRVIAIPAGLATEPMEEVGEEGEVGGGVEGREGVL